MIFRLILINYVPLDIPWLNCDSVKVWCVCLDIVHSYHANGSKNRAHLCCRYNGSIKIVLRFKIIILHLGHDCLWSNKL